MALTSLISDISNLFDSVLFSMRLAVRDYAKNHTNGSEIFSDKSAWTGLFKISCVLLLFHMILSFGKNLDFSSEVLQNVSLRERASA